MFVSKKICSVQVSAKVLKRIFGCKKLIEQYVLHMLCVILV